MIQVRAPVACDVGTVSLNSLPDAPAHPYTGFAVCCTDREASAATITWFRRLRLVRPAVPLGLVARPQDCAQSLARLDHVLCFLLAPDQLKAGGLPEESMAALRRASVEGTVFEEIVSGFGDQVIGEAEIIAAVVARAVHGGTLTTVGRDLQVHSDTVSRRLKRIGISADLLRRWIRLRAFELRVELGMDRATALLAGGWSDHDQRRKAMTRFRQTNHTQLSI